MSEKFDWSRFTQKIKIKAPLEKVYAAWSSQQELEKWFLRYAGFKDVNGEMKSSNEAIVKGDTYLWHWHGYPDSVKETGVILEANGKDHLSFVFGEAGTVSVHLNATDGVTEMSITQENIPTDNHGMENYHVGCATGWTFYRVNLKSVLEGGLDLRNKGNDVDNND